MNGHAITQHSLSYEESLSLLDEKTLSDIESECGHADIEARFKVQDWASTAKNNMNFLRSVPFSSWRLVLTRVGVFFLPSFLQSRIIRQQGRPEKLMPTSYLDGMRGLAALIVFFCHYFYQAYIIAESYGSAPSNNYFLKLPIIRLFYQGPPAVCLFFVISGYALSYKPLKLMRSAQHNNFATTMSSMTFRRIIRLYLPTTISTFMIFLLLRLGVFEWTRAFANDRTYMRNVVEPHPERLETFSQQFYHWAWSLFNFVHVFGWERYGGSTGYDVHLWTIPVEFRCSMYLFVTLVGVARLRTSVRFLVMFLIMAFTYRNSRWELLLFYFGTIIAELDLMRGAHVVQPALPTTEKGYQRGSLRGIGWASLSVLALYLMSQPDVRAAETPGWKWLVSIIPQWWGEEQYRYWQSAGSIIFVVCVSHSPNWQKFFNLPALQYLGKISYSIYLMHGPVTHTLGYMIEKRAYAITGVHGNWYHVGFVLGSFGVIPAVIWAADIFWRLFDIPTVKLARWLETKCVVKEA